MRKRGRLLRELWGKEADFEVEKEIAERILRKWDWGNSERKEISEVNNEISEGILIESRRFLRKSKRCLREFRGKGDLWVNFEGKNWRWRRKWQPTPVFLPGESHGQRNLVGYSPQGCRVGYNGATILYWFLKQRKTLMIFWGEGWKFLVKKRFLRELFRKEGDFWRNSEEKEVSLRVTERRVRGI